MAHDIEQLVGQRVVLDTAGFVLYLGTLSSVLDAGFWLTEADVHDCREGHASAEVYIMNAAVDGITPNRKRVFVLRATVLSVSGLDDIIAEYHTTEGGAV